MAIGDDLLVMSKSSPALRDAIDAVAMLHAQRQGSLTLIEKEGNDKQSAALQAYARSVRCTQREIAAGTFMDNRSALWVTFLLGLFEVCISWTESDRTALICIHALTNIIS